MMPIKVPIEVVDDHNEALNFYYKLIARNKIPFEGLCLVHLDSHPDLACPETIPIEQFTSRNQLLDNLTISDWILPAVYQQHFTTVVWIKPPWAYQIPSGKHSINIGRDKNGLLKTSSALAYYVSELCSFENLENTKTLDLIIVELDTHNNNLVESYQLLRDVLQNRNWCLDVDMDFFSTQNPFKSILGEHFDFIHDLFKFIEKEDVQESLNNREIQLSCLKHICNSDSSPMIQETCSKYSNFYQSLLQIYPNLHDDISKAKCKVSSDEFITDLFYIGQQTELPDHVSSMSEIRYLLDKTEKLLQMLSECDSVSEPVAISLARSEYDEYSAPETLDFVHCSLICMLKKIYGISPNAKCPKL